MATSELMKRLEPLGRTRGRILGCLGGDIPSLPQYLALRPGDDVFTAFRAFVERMIKTCAATNEQPTRALIGAARLLIGDISGADEVLENLPAAPVKLDHGAGYCRVVPMEALEAALPLPANLRGAYRWIAGSSEQAALRTWLEQHRAQLTWNETRGEYQH